MNNKKRWSKVTVWSALTNAGQVQNWFNRQQTSSPAPTPMKFYYKNCGECYSTPIHKQKNYLEIYMYTSNDSNYYSYSSHWRFYVSGGEEIKKKNLYIKNEPILTININNLTFWFFAFSSLKLAFSPIFLPFLPQNIGFPNIVKNRLLIVYPNFSL